MLKKIHVQDLKVGMYIHEICGSWMDHPFWKKSFKVLSQKQLQILTESSISEVWIDTGRGVDVEVNAELTTVEEDQLKVAKILSQISQEEMDAAFTVPLEEEMVRARKITEQARNAICAMFQEARLGKALHMDDTAALVEEISQSISRNPHALLSVARLKTKDNYTYMHSVSVCALMMALGRKMKLDGDLLKELGMAGLLHDVGKIMTPDEVLNKQHSLTAEEFEVMKAHPRHGWEILERAYGASDMTLDVCLHHHERMDGRGYPDGLSGEGISLFARMGAVCDVYDAITSVRCYKAAWEPAEAIRKMAEWKDGNYDETVFFAFVKTLGIYPVGTLVKLKSGRLGVVVAQSEKSLLTPVVKTFFSSRANAMIFPERVELAKSQDSIVSVEDHLSWKFDCSYLAGVA